MCRMLLHNASTNVSLSEKALKGIKEMARNGLSARCGIGPHGDGFGVAWFLSNGYGIYKNLKPIWEENIPNIPALSHIIHARKKSRGEIDFIDTHPLQLRDLILAHNGTIYSFNRRPTLFKPMGKTDSEVFLCLLAEAYYTGSNIRKALEYAIESVDMASSLNMFIVSLSEKKIIVINLFSNVPRCPEYYVLWLHRNDEEFYVVSEPIKEMIDWEPLSQSPDELTILETIIGNPRAIAISRC
ncbi:MAG: class II glutamine amidotransferase [Candidatus Njordarchaeales archaeon]